MDIENVKNLEVHLKGPKISFKAGLQIKNIGEKKTLNLRIGFGPLQFDEEGDYRFETYAENSSEPIVIKSFPVRVREDLKIK
jgi:hypothetical protein